MPFVEQKDRRGPIMGAPAEGPKRRPNFLNETIPAAFRIDNTIASSIASFSGTGASENYDPFADMDKLKGYEDELTSFAYVRSDLEMERMKAAIDQERKDRETLADAGMAGFVASFGASMLDPTILAPVGGQIRKGETILRASGRVAAAAGFGAAAQESILHSTQQTRKVEESVYAIGGSVVLGALLGGGAAALSKKEFARMAAQIDADLRAADDAAGDAGAAASQAGNLSAAQRATTTLEDETIAGWGLEATARTLGAFDAVTRLATNISLVGRKIGQSMTEGSYILNKNLPKTVRVEVEPGKFEEQLVLGEPQAQAVESFIRRKTEVFNGEIITAIDDAYGKYFFGRDRKMGDMLRAGVAGMTGRAGGKISRGQFMGEISKAMRRGDKHDIPEVQAAAQAIRPHFEKLVDEGVDLGMFGVRRVESDNPGEPDFYENIRPNVDETAESWLARLYDHDMIVRNEDEFVDILTEHYIGKRDKAKRDLDNNQFYLGVTLRPQKEGLRSAVRAFIRERDSLFRTAREEIAKAQQAFAKSKAVAREAETQAVAADKRVRELASRHMTAEQDAYYTGLLKEVNRGRGDYEPVSLTQFIRKNGGILDWETVSSKEALYRQNLINSKGGRPLDTLREMAVESGYFHEDGDLNQFVQAIMDDLGDNKIYRDIDLEQAGYNEWLREIAKEAEKDGVDLQSVVDFANWHQKAEYVERTPFKKGRIAEAEKRERYSVSRLEKHGDAVEIAEYALHEAKVMARTLREHAPELTKRIREYEKELRRVQGEERALRRRMARDEIRADMSDAEMRSVAIRTKQRILSGPAGRVSYDGPQVRKQGGRKKNDPGLSQSFHSRVLDIPDVKIEKFLKNDIEEIVRATARGMIPDIELTKRFGSLDMELSIKDVKDDFEKINEKIARDLKAAIKDETDPDKIEKAKKKAGDRRAAANRQREKAEEDILAIRDRMRGTYRLPDDPNSLGHRVIRGALTVNHFRLMGGVTSSSIPDAPRMVFANGIENFMGPGLKAFTGQLSALKLPLSEVKWAGPGYELVNNTKLASVSDLLAKGGRTSGVERIMDNMRSNFAFTTLIAPWNHTLKSLTGLTVQNRILKATRNLKAGRISKKDAIYLSRLGIGQEDALAIAQKFKAHGADVDGVLWANTSAWQDEYLAEVFHNAMRKEIDRVIVTPGQEKPLVFSGPMGKLIGQFRSYNMAATQRVLLAATQGMAFGDAQVLLMVISQVGLGMMVAKMKAESNGVDTSEWEPRKWVVEGVDRSGIMAILTEANILLEHGTRGRYGLSALSGQGLITRYHSRNKIGAFLGPTAGLFEDALTASSAILSGDEMSAGDIKAMRRLMLYQNHIGVRRMFDAAEASAIQAFAE